MYRVGPKAVSERKRGEIDDEYVEFRRRITPVETY